MPVQIDKMTDEEAIRLLRRKRFAHMACSHHDHPYIIPLNYEFADGVIYLFTSEGKKTDFLSSNPEVCIQVESVKNHTKWKSVIVVGKAERIRDPEKRKRAVEVLRHRNPQLTPAVNRTWKDTWGLHNVLAVYRIRPEIITGRKTGY